MQSFARTLATSSNPSAALQAVIAAAGLRAIARISESDRATDFAIPLSITLLTLIRCSDRPGASDHSALATMVAEGDFAWAGLVYGEREGPEIAGPVESFHVSELDRLTVRLLELREVFGEAG